MNKVTGLLKTHCDIISQSDNCEVMLKHGIFYSSG